MDDKSIYRRSQSDDFLSDVVVLDIFNQYSLKDFAVILEKFFV